MEVKEVKCTHAGQYRAYGDSYYVYELYLEGDYSKEDVLDYCFKEISRRKMQSRREWSEAHGDPGKYFAGYYELIKTDYGYKYTVCFPYTD
jgi:hypothetical protein